MIVPDPTYYSLESERLSFRSIAKSDIPLWEPFFEDNPSLRFLGMGSPEFKDLSNREKCERWLNRQMERKEEGQYGQLAVIEKASGKFIGVGGLIYRNEMGVENDLEVTYSLLTEFHGKGYGTELAILFKNFALEHTELKTAISIIHKENEASINVARKNDMVIDYSLDDYMGMPVHIYRTQK